LEVNVMNTVDDCRARLEALGWHATEQRHPECRGGGWAVTATRGDRRFAAGSLTQAGAWRVAWLMAQQEG
jgi:hypothetical protein